MLPYNRVKQAVRMELLVTETRKEVQGGLTAVVLIRILVKNGCVACDSMVLRHRARAE